MKNLSLKNNKETQCQPSLGRAQLPTACRRGLWPSHTTSWGTGPHPCRHPQSKPGATFLNQSTSWHQTSSDMKLSNFCRTGDGALAPQCLYILLDPARDFSSGIAWFGVALQHLPAPGHRKGKKPPRTLKTSFSWKKHPDKLQTPTPGNSVVQLVQLVRSPAIPPPLCQALTPSPCPGSSQPICKGWIQTKRILTFHPPPAPHV